MKSYNNRNEMRKARTQELIRHFAIKAFLERGYAKTTIGEIMNLADLGYGTFYQYYRSKQDVLSDQVKDLLELITSHYMMPESSEHDLYQRTLHSIRNIFNTCHQHRDILRVLLDAQSADEELRELLQSFHSVLFQRLETDITWSMRKGLCRDVDQATALVALDGLVKGAIQYLITRDFTKEQIERISQDVARLLKEAIFITESMPQEYIDRNR